MGVAVMPVLSEAPARRNARSSRVANDAASNQPDRTADDSARQRSQRAVAEPLLGVRNRRHEADTGDRRYKTKPLQHACAPMRMSLMDFSKLFAAPSWKK